MYKYMYKDDGKGISLNALDKCLFTMYRNKFDLFIYFLQVCFLHSAYK